MKVITCASYYGSGSSALTDLVAEYKNVKDLSNFEIRFVHQLDGISDLEYHLVENHNRQNSGHALKRFARLSHFYEGNFLSRQYSQFFKENQYHDITVQYIDSLTDLKFNGWNFYDLYDKGYVPYYILQIFNHLYRKTGLSFLKILNSEKTICAHPTKEKFLSCTRNYTHKILEALNKESKEYLEVDQIVSSSNIERMLRYFKDEVFVIVVNRDPRDVFLLNKYYWKEHVSPLEADLFCKWFRYTHEAGNGIPEDNPHILKINFEDIVYKYDETVAMIESMTGLKPELHDNKFTKMNPKRSIVNTRVWLKFPNDDDAKLIEKELPEFLYDYSNVDTTFVQGIEVKDNSNF